jgi:hypothetical protein
MSIYAAGSLPIGHVLSANKSTDYLNFSLFPFSSKVVVVTVSYASFNWKSIGFEGLTAVVRKNPIFRDKTPPPLFALVSSSAYSSVLKVEATCSSETSVDCQQTTRRYIPEPA